MNFSAYIAQIIFFWLLISLVILSYLYSNSDHSNVVHTKAVRPSKAIVSADEIATAKLLEMISNLRKIKDILAIRNVQNENVVSTVSSSSSGNVPPIVPNNNKPETLIEASPISSTSTSLSSRKLHIVTYATHGGRDDRFCRAVESALMNDVQLVILGWGEKWVGLSQKLSAALLFSQSIPKTDVMMFVDAFDVMFTKTASNHEDLLNKFKALNSSILFSAECGCWPHVIEDPAICLKQYPNPPSPSPYRYLNSGAWIGYADEASKLLSDVQIKAGNNWDTANDQKLVADMFLLRQHDIQLDYMNVLFQSMHMTYDPPLAYCDPMASIVLDEYPTTATTTTATAAATTTTTTANINSGSNSKDQVVKVWRNKLTDGQPAVFHFNGGGKTHHPTMEAQGWYKSILHSTPGRVQQLSSHPLVMPSVTHPIRTMTFRDICGDYLRTEYGYA